MSFPRYPSYKNSNVSWIGMVPEQWEIARIDSKAETHRQTLTASDLDGVDVFHYSIPVVQERGTGQLEEGAGIDSNKLRIDRKQLLISKLNPHKQTMVVADSYPNVLTVASTEFVPLVPTSCVMEYLAYAWKSQACLDYLLARCDSATRSHQRVDPTDITKAAWAWPSLEEQNFIVAFLDRETAKIDALVAEQEQLITLLKEKRQAVISHAVTKGLDPSVRMKDSGVEWLGEVPEHWLFGPVKHFLALRGDAIKTGPFGSHLTAAEMQVGSIKVYNQRNVIDCDFEGGDNFITEEKFQELRSFETYPGDLLITTRGTIGRAAILPSDAERGILHPCLLRVQPDTSRLRTQFLRALVQDSDLLRTQLSYLSNATTIEVIYSYTIASVVIPVPPVDEQDAILDALTEKLAELDNLTQEAQRAVELLQERRSALISAAVTGQIDVRGLAT